MDETSDSVSQDSFEWLTNLAARKQKQCIRCKVCGEWGTWTGHVCEECRKYGGDERQAHRKETAKR